MLLPLSIYTLLFWPFVCICYMLRTSRFWCSDVLKSRRCSEIFAIVRLNAEAHEYRDAIIAHSVPFGTYIPFHFPHSPHASSWTSTHVSRTVLPFLLMHIRLYSRPLDKHYRLSVIYISLRVAMNSYSSIFSRFTVYSILCACFLFSAFTPSRIDFFAEGFGNINSVPYFLILALIFLKKLLNFWGSVSLYFLLNLRQFVYYFWGYCVASPSGVRGGVSAPLGTKFSQEPPHGEPPLLQ